MGSGNVNHNFFIFDLLPEKVVLGMDFMAEKQAIINMEKALFEIPAYDINVDIDIDCGTEAAIVHSHDTDHFPWAHDVG